MHGELSADTIAKQRLLNNAIGGLFFIEEQNFVHGSLYFNSRNFTVLWDQVRSGGYANCRLSLGVKRGEAEVEGQVWKNGPLSITSASFDFSHPPDALAEAGFNANQKKSGQRRDSDKTGRVIKGFLAVLTLGLGVALAVVAFNELIHSNVYTQALDVAVPAMFASMFLLGSFLLLRRKA